MSVFLSLQEWNKWIIKDYNFKIGCFLWYLFQFSVVRSFYKCCRYWLFPNYGNFPKCLVWLLSFFLFPVISLLHVFFMFIHNLYTFEMMIIFMCNFVLLYKVDSLITSNLFHYIHLTPSYTVYPSECMTTFTFVIRNSYWTIINIFKFIHRKGN